MKPLRTALLALVALGAFACSSAQDGPTDEGLPPDGEHESIAPAGKADSLFSQCEVDSALLSVNDPSAGVETLKAAGLHTRAARNVVEVRNGPDGVPATEDDVVFRTLKELDDVSWVGPVALSQLAKMGSEHCPAGAYPTTESIFSPQEKDDSHLARAAELIDGAQHSVDVAMYSFSDSKIMDALDRAHDRGVKVRFLFEPARDEAKDPAGTKSAQIEAAGIDVRFVNKIMHHKFMIVDGPIESRFHALGATLMSGSANWSSSAATRYDENTVILRGVPELSLKFQREFNLLWENSRDFELGAPFDHVTSLQISDWMLLDDSSADVAFTSNNFKVFQNSYGLGFSVVSGRNTVADRLVGLIQSAESQILVASGHLRSRPVAEALLAKHAENPDLDIRVYLDGQEYVSSYTNTLQEKELADCLAAAGTSVSKQQQCNDKGYYWSYPVHDAGIPLRFKHYAYRWHYSYAEQMHHKYLLVDGKTLASGSYNLSDNAEHATMENMVIYGEAGYAQLIGEFSANFEEIWLTGESEGLYEKLLDEVQNGTGSVPIVYDSMALGHEQVTTLKSAIRDACPDVDSDDFRKYPEKHYVCYR